jgi:hypothetical protein
VHSYLVDKGRVMRSAPEVVHNREGGYGALRFVIVTSSCDHGETMARATWL